MFNINFAMCIEFTGDELLRSGETRSALQCYNVARVSPLIVSVSNSSFNMFINRLDTICENSTKTSNVRRKQCTYAFVCNGPENIVHPEEHTSAQLSYQLFGRSARP